MGFGNKNGKINTIKMVKFIYKLCFYTKDMVIIEKLLKEGKIIRIVETELKRYIDFFTATYEENLEHSKDTVETHPRWSIISGYYAMHDISKLLIAMVYRLKMGSFQVHTITIKILKELLRDKEILELLSRGYEESRDLVQDLSVAKKDRVKVQYYTGTEFMKGKYKEKAKEFYETIVIKYIEKIQSLLDGYKNDN